MCSELSKHYACVFADALLTQDKATMESILLKTDSTEFKIELAKECGRRCVDINVCKYYISISCWHEYYNAGLYQRNDLQLVLDYGLGAVNRRIAAEVGATNIMDHLGYCEYSVYQYLRGCFMECNTKSLQHLISKGHLNKCNHFFNESLNTVTETMLLYGLECGLTLTEESVKYLKENRQDLYKLIEEQV